MEEKYLQTVDSDSHISWAAYHASQQIVDQCLPATITAHVTPFHDNSKSAAMIQHSMKVIKQAVQKLNPSQVITLDQNEIKTRFKLHITH